MTPAEAKSLTPTRRQAGGDHAAHGEAQGRGRGGVELDVGAQLLVGEAADVAQPRPDPQRDAADEGELLDGEQRLDAPVEAVGQHRAGDAELLGAACRCARGRGAFGHDDEQDRRRGEAEAGQPEEQALPAHDRQRPFDRAGSPPSSPAPPAIMWKPVIRPQRSGGYHSVIALIAAIRPPAKPRPISTRATISSPQREAEPEQRRAGRRHRQQHDLHAARPVAVEHDAQHRLAAGEEQEEGRGEQPEIARRDADVALEIGEDHGVHAAEDVGEEIGERERQEDPQEQRGEGRGACGHRQSIQEMRND